MIYRKETEIEGFVLINGSLKLNEISNLLNIINKGSDSNGGVG